MVRYRSEQTGAPVAGVQPETGRDGRRVGRDTGRTRDVIEPLCVAAADADDGQRAGGAGRGRGRGHSAAATRAIFEAAESWDEWRSNRVSNRRQKC